MTTTNQTKGQIVAADVAALLRARNPLLWIVSREEARVESHLIQAAAKAGYKTYFWDVAQGVTGVDGKPVAIGAIDPDATLDAIRDRAIDPNNFDRSAFIMRDLPVWVNQPSGAPTSRRLRNLSRLLPGIEPARSQAVIVLSPDGDVPADLAGHATVIEWPLPDRAEIGGILDATIEPYGDKIAPLNGQREAAIDATLGLTQEEAQACYAKSLVQLRKIDPVTVAHEKKRVITRERVLEWYDPLPGGLDSVGGLDVVKSWLAQRKLAYTPAARAYGLPMPKGMVLVGVSGCGKTLIAKATSTAWQVPLLRLDPGALKSKFVGSSEANLRKALAVIDAIGPCVVFIDEVEKALQGSTSGSADGGVSADQMGSILNWMQERKSGAFVIVTANDVSGLPPEFLRKGRFDEVFWVDVPNVTERVEVLKATLRSHGRGDADIDLQHVARTCKDFTGAEIAALVPEALFTAFADQGREITTDDLIKAANGVVPLTDTAKEKIAEMRKWAKGRTRPATSDAGEDVTPQRARVLEL